MPELSVEIDGPPLPQALYAEPGTAAGGGARGGAEQERSRANPKAGLYPAITELGSSQPGCSTAQEWVDCTLSCPVRCTKRSICKTIDNTCGSLDPSPRYCSLPLSPPKRTLHPPRAAADGTQDHHGCPAWAPTRPCQGGGACPAHTGHCQSHGL